MSVILVVFGVAFFLAVLATLEDIWRAFRGDEER
jgi:hypothetical protein